jgi:predicted dehydrogenase
MRPHGLLELPLMRIAVFGLGFMGSTHLKAWKNVKGATLFAVADETEKRLTGDLSDIQGNIGGPGEKMDFSQVRKYRTTPEALADAEIEAVDICLPTDQHVPVAVAALRAGKHVLVEKPLALDAAGADQVLAAAAKSGKVLMTGQVCRFNPAYHAAAQMLRSGSLGEVRSALLRRRCAAPAWSKWMHKPEISGGGVFDLLIHDVDACLYAFGAPQSVSAIGYEGMARGIDFIEARLQYANGATVIITGGWHHPRSYPFSMEFTVNAEGGTLEYSSAGRPLTIYRADGETDTPSLPDPDIFQEEIEYFLECAKTGRKPERCPPEESAQAVKLMRLMLESRSRKGETIACKF